MRLVHTVTKLPVFLPCFFYFWDFPWTIGNNTTISIFIVPAYDFNFRDLAAIYTAPVVSAVLRLVIGHFLFDFTRKLWAKRHGGRIDPELGWGMHNFATIITTTAVGTSLLDAYPVAGGECAAWLNFARALSGFIVGYI
ncbi:hypothetical protein DV736_g6610, partial [Chaetothyriales sp. CBS 134916]